MTDELYLEKLRILKDKTNKKKKKTTCIFVKQKLTELWYFQLDQYSTFYALKQHFSVLVSENAKKIIKFKAP